MTSLVSCTIPLDFLFHKPDKPYVLRSLFMGFCFTQISQTLANRFSLQKNASVQTLTLKASVFCTSNFQGNISPLQMVILGYAVGIV